MNGCLHTSASLILMPLFLSLLLVLLRIALLLLLAHPHLLLLIGLLLPSEVHSKSHDNGCNYL